MNFNRVHLFLIFFLFSWLPLAGQEPYFQQEVNYNIKVSLSDSNHYLHGIIDIQYKNNSSKALDTIYFHLWPNGYKHRNTALGRQLIESGKSNFYFAEEEDRGFIDSLQFKIKGTELKMAYDSVDEDICFVVLPASLKSGQTIQINTPFRVKIPSSTFSRLGHIGNSYQITQWFPKPAVFDRDGWHAMPYLDQGEFYSEFGTFDVSITLPSYYVVAASGDMFENPEEEKKLDELKLFSQLLIENPDSSANQNNLLKDSTLKTLRFKLEHAHDFAWFADPAFLLLEDSVTLGSGKTVLTRAYFSPLARKTWKKVPKYVGEALTHYSKWTTEYPYSHASAVYGPLSAGGGMEYPTITIIGDTPNESSLRRVTIHEVGHNWFYGFLGNNERAHPWLDEGLNSYYEIRTMKAVEENPANIIESNGKGSDFLLKMLGLQNLTEESLTKTILEWKAASRLDQPLNLSSEDYDPTNYGLVVYQKTAFLLSMLEDWLGTELFDACMKSYAETWKFKHPTPVDLKLAFEKTSGQNLSWFFTDWFQSTQYPDYAIRLKKQGNRKEIQVKNKSAMIAPFQLDYFSNDSLVKSIKSEGFIGKKTFPDTGFNFDFAVVDRQKKLLEVYRSNNQTKTKGPFKTVEPFHLKFFTGVSKPEQTQLYFMPYPAYNHYDRFMAGILFYNGLLPEKKFEYMLAPAYSIGAQKLVGFGSVKRNFFPGGKALIRKITLGLNGKTYTFDHLPILTSYWKLAPFLEVNFRNPNPAHKISRKITIRSVFLQKDIPSWQTNELKFSKFTYTYNINELAYSVKVRRTVLPYFVELKARQGEGFVQGTITASVKLNYNSKRALHVRFFNGKFFQQAASNQIGFSLAGNNDYLMDHTFLGRSQTNGWSSKQFFANEGGFRNDAGDLLIRNWLTSLNLTSELPFKSPFRVYGDLGVSDHSASLEYDAGIAIYLTEMVQVFLPFAMSAGLDQTHYFEKVRFSVNLHLVNPFTISREAFE